MTDELVTTEGDFYQVIEYFAFLTPDTNGVTVPTPKPTIHRSHGGSGFSSSFTDSILDNIVPAGNPSNSYKIGPLFSRDEVVEQVKARMKAIQILHPEVTRVNVKYDIKEYWIKDVSDDNE
jgi:hypothetical protein